MLLRLPSEVQRTVLGYSDDLGYRSLLFLCRPLHRLLRRKGFLGEDMRRWFFARMDIDVAPLGLTEDSVDWNSLLFAHTLLMDRLLTLPSPGTQLNKYLQWVWGVPAYSIPILRCIFLASLLSPTDDSLHREDGKVVGPSPESGILIRFLIYWISVDFSEYHVPNESFPFPAISRDDWTAMISMIDAHHCSLFFHWISEPGKGYRLKQLLAEVEGIQVRLVDYSFSTNQFLHSRLTMAFCSLASLSKMDDGVMNYWAS